MAVDFEALERKLQECSGVISLENGVTIIYEDIPSFGLVRGEIQIRAGSHHEPEKDYGVMHFLEHMTFNGSARHPNAQEREERASLLGLIKNAETGSHSVNFGIRGRSEYLLEGNFLESFGMVSDLVFNPLLREGDIEKERAIIQAERKEREQKKVTDYTYALTDFINVRLCANNPSHFREGIGTQSTIDAITAEKLRMYHRRYFCGANTIVSLVGDLNDGSHVLTNVVDSMQKIPKGQYADIVEPRPEIPYDGREFIHIPSSPNSSCAIVQVYFQIPNPNQDAYRRLMLSEVLVGSSQGLLHQELRERKGLIYAASCSTEGGHEKTGFLGINYYVDVSRIDESLAALDTCLEDMKRGCFRETLVDAAKATYIPGILAALKQPGWAQKERLFRHKAKMYAYDETGFDDRKIFSIAKIDVVDAANKYLGENRLIVVVSP